jgi:hypothetical protein
MKALTEGLFYGLQFLIDDYNNLYANKWMALAFGKIILA